VTATATSFSLSKHTGEGDTGRAFSSLCVYLQFTWEVGLPPSPVEFSSHHRFYKLSCSWLLGGSTAVFAFSGWRYLQLREGFPFPLFNSQGTPPSLLPVFFVVIAYYSVFFLFSLGVSWSVQGAMLIWPRDVCGSTVCHFAHLVVCIFPRSLGAGVWQSRSPPGFPI
jgi:hypothetical protein